MEHLAPIYCQGSVKGSGKESSLLFLKKLNMEPFHMIQAFHSSIFTQEKCKHTSIQRRTKMFTTALLGKPKTGSNSMSISRWMDKPIVPPLYNEMPLIINTCSIVTLKIIVLSGQSQTKNIYCVIPFPWNSRKFKVIYSSRKQIKITGGWRRVARES